MATLKKMAPANVVPIDLKNGLALKDELRSGKVPMYSTMIADNDMNINFSTASKTKDV